MSDVQSKDESRWDTAVDWLLNHPSSYDTSALFYAFVDGLITEDELRTEMAAEMLRTNRGAVDLIEERRKRGWRS